MENKPKTFPQPLILAAYPNVETNVPQQGHQNGVFIVGIEGGFFLQMESIYSKST